MEKIMEKIVIITALTAILILGSTEFFVGKDLQPQKVSNNESK